MSSELFHLELHKNPVKKTKLKRIYAKMDKTTSLIYNLENNKIGMKELISIIELLDPQTSIEHEISVDLSKKIGQTALICFSNYEKKVVLINKDESTSKIDPNILKEILPFSLHILDLTNKLAKNDFYKENNNASANIINKKELLERLNRNSGYNSFENYASSYFDYTYSRAFSLELALKLGNELKWNNNQIELFMKESKLYPGDIIPSAENSKNIINKIKYKTEGLLTDGEAKFLQEKIDLLYLNIEGRFPNINDLIEILNHSHIKQKDLIINKLMTSNNPISDLKNKEQKTTTIDILHNELNKFLEGNKIYKNPDSYFFVSGTLWNSAYLNNEIELFYQELIKINNSNNYHVVNYGYEQGKPYPLLKIYIKMHKEIEKINLSVFETIKE